MPTRRSFRKRVRGARSSAGGEVRCANSAVPRGRAQSSRLSCRRPSLADGERAAARGTGRAAARVRVLAAHVEQDDERAVHTAQTRPVTLRVAISPQIPRDVRRSRTAAEGWPCGGLRARPLYPPCVLMRKQQRVGESIALMGEEHSARTSAVLAVLVHLDRDSGGRVGACSARKALAASATDYRSAV